MGYNESLGTDVVIIAWVLLAASSLSVGLRFWVRLTRVHRVAADDWLILASLLCEFVHSICISIAYTYGLGRHVAILSDHDRIHTIKWIVIIQFWAIITSVIGRISFAAFLLQIVGRTEKWQKAFLWGVIITQLAVNIPTVIQIYTQCGTDVAALWDPVVAAHAHCMSSDVQTVIGFVQSGINSACDLVLTVLPCFVLWHLHMPLTNKIGLGAVLTLSIFALGASIVKAVEIKNLGAKGDFTCAFVILTIWVCIENNVVIIAACIPTLRPIMKGPGAFSTHNSSKRRQISLPYGKSYNSTGSETVRSPESAKKDTDLPWLGRRSSSRNELTIQGRSRGALRGDSSEEFILHILSDQHITKTTDVRVAYESHDQESVPENASHLSAQTCPPAMERDR